MRRTPRLLLLLALVLAAGLVPPPGPPPTAAARAPSWPPRPDFQKGMSYAVYAAEALNSPASDASLDRLARTGTHWVALVPVWYMQTATSTTIFAHPEDTPTDPPEAGATPSATSRRRASRCSLSRSSTPRRTSGAD